MKWFRVYNEVLHDSKVQTLSPELFRVWINLLCLASGAEDRGTLPALSQIAFSLRIKEDKASQLIGKLISIGLIDEAEDGGLSPHNWVSRQTDGASSTERVKRYRQRIRSAGETVTGYTKHRAEVFARDGRACVYCGAKKSLVLDHLVPVLKGGTGDPDNLVTACKSCNAGKSGRLVGEAGYSFLRHETAAQYLAALSRFSVTDDTFKQRDTCHALSRPETVTVTPVTPLEEIRLEEKRLEEKNTPPNPHSGGGVCVSANGAEPVPIEDIPPPTAPVIDAEMSRVMALADRLFDQSYFGAKIPGIAGDGDRQFPLPCLEEALHELHAAERGKQTWKYFLGIAGRIKASGAPARASPKATSRDNDAIPRRKSAAEIEATTARYQQWAEERKAEGKR